MQKNNVQMNDRKSFVKSAIYQEAFIELQTECFYNKKTSHISHEYFQTSDYLTSLPPKLAKLVFKAKTSMRDINANFKNKYAIFINGLRIPSPSFADDITLLALHSSFLKRS